MAHRADGLSDIFEHSVIIRDNLNVGGIITGALKVSVTNSIMGTNSYVADTVYQNTRKTTIQINVNMFTQVYDSGDRAWAAGFVGPSNPPAYALSGCGDYDYQVPLASSAAQQRVWNFSFAVNPGEYWKITTESLGSGSQFVLVLNIQEVIFGA